MSAVRAYRLFLSPWLGSGCRFEPTCSVYSLRALDAHGAAAGTWLTVHRLLRCGPWCEGGHDPVPANAPKLFACLPSLVESASRHASQADLPSSHTPPTPGPHP